MGARAVLRRADGSMGDAFPIAAPPMATSLFVPTLTAGRKIGAGDRNALLVNRRLLGEEPTLTVGSIVTLMIAGKPTEWTVVGSADTGPAASAYTTRETLATLLGSARSSTVVIDGAITGAAADFELLQRLRSTLADAGRPIQTGQLMSQQRASIEDHLLMVAGFLGSMSLLMIVVGGLGLASTMSMAVLERTREIGVMRAIGARHRAIVAIVQVEGLVVALLSWLVALPLSIPMSVILGKAFGRVMLPVPVILLPESRGVVIWLAVVVGVSVVACAWPAWRAMRVPVAKALAYE
jgi:putative ABC transport system permease protein